MAAHKTNRPRSAARAEPEESLCWPHPNPLAIAAAAGNALRCIYTHPDYRWTVYTVDADWVLGNGFMSLARPIADAFYCWPPNLRVWSKSESKFKQGRD